MGGTFNGGGATSSPRRDTGGALGGETVRALVVFSLLFLALSGVAGHLAIRELALQATWRRLDIGQDEAERIADAVAALGWSREGVDFARLQSGRDLVIDVINERLWRSPYVKNVEVVDRAGRRLVFLTRDAVDDRAPFAQAPARENGPVEVVTATMGRGADVQGEVRLGIAQEAFAREFQELRRSLQMKVLAAASVGVAVLVIGFVYVLHLIRKNRRLERSRLAAERRAYAGLLASALAHEIRNPLNAMNMNLQMLEEELQGLDQGAGGSETAELLVSTKSEIHRLSKLVNDFLEYARPIEPQLTSRDVNELLRALGRFHHAEFARAGVEFTLDLAESLPPVDLDEGRLGQAIKNLLGNARQVVRPGGHVTLRSRLAGGEVLVEVQDDGPGISAELRERVFEAFYSTRGGGTGLGLPIARRIVEQHGGTLEVDSDAGVGTIFRIHLPPRSSRSQAPSPAAEAAS